MPPRFEFARRKARELIKELSISCAPVPLKRLAAHLNASIRYAPYDGSLSGMVHRKPDGTAVIGVNSQHPLVRQRFTIAHEIAHLVLHKDEVLHVDHRYLIGLRSDVSSEATDPSEVEANQFAAELLMPKELIFSDLQELPDELEPEVAIRRIAAKYKVSTQALTIRLHALGILD
jgi:Zn-dependent peptidase ImmA (M78 family)